MMKAIFADGMTPGLYILAFGIGFFLAAVIIGLGIWIWDTYDTWRINR